MATIVRADGTTEVIAGPLRLERMQQIVDGNIEIVYFGGTARRREILIVNEDGHRLGLPINHYATARYQGTPPRHDHVIVGDVIAAILIDPGMDTEAIL